MTHAKDAEAKAAEARAEAKARADAEVAKTEAGAEARADAEARAEAAKRPPNCLVEFRALGPYAQGDVVERAAVEELGSVADYLAQGVVSETRQAVTRKREVPTPVSPTLVGDLVAELEAENVRLKALAEERQKELDGLKPEVIDHPLAGDPALRDTKAAADEIARLRAENAELRGAAEAGHARHDPKKKAGS